MDNILAKVVKYLLDKAFNYWLHSNDNRLLGIILIFGGLFLLFFGVGNGFSFAAVTCPAPNDSYMGLSVWVGVAVMVTGGFLAFKPKANKRPNSLRVPRTIRVKHGPTSETKLRKSANELEQEVMVFMMDIFEGKFDTDLQVIADDAIIAHKQQKFPLCTCFLSCLRETKYLGELHQTTIFQLEQPKASSLSVSDSSPLLPDALKMALIQDAGSSTPESPKRHASIAFIEQAKVKIYFNNSIPFLLEDVGELKAGERMYDFIALTGVRKPANTFCSSVAIPIPQHKGNSSFGVLCIDGNSLDQFVGNENDRKLDQVARLVSVIMEIQSFFNDLFSLSLQP